MGFAFLVFLTDAKVANIFQLISRLKYDFFFFLKLLKYDFGTYVFHCNQFAYNILAIINSVHITFKL